MMRTVMRIVVAVTAAAQVAAAGAAAQEVRDSARLEAVVVTATRLPTPQAAVPAAVSVLDGRELERRGLRTVSEALRDVAGLDVVQSGAYGGVTSLFVRGGESDYVKVLVDGVPVNDPGGAVDLADLTTDNVERIEIVRGPVSVLYGSDAVSGVVQIFTRRGAGATRGDVTLRAGSYTAVDVLGGVTGGTDAVAYAVTASRSRTDGMYEFNSGYSNTVWSGMLAATPDARTDAKLVVRHGASDYHFPTNSAGEVEDANAFQRRTRTMASLEIGRFLASAIEGRASLGLNQFDGGIDDRPDGPSDTLGFFAYNSVQTMLRRNADLRMNAYLPGGSILSVGGTIEWQRERSATESGSEFGPSASAFEAERTNHGYYAQLQSTPFRDLALSIGGRLDDNSAFGTFASYRGGASYTLPTHTRLRVSVGRGFKEPTFFENFADDPFARGNPDLRPERSRSWEVGIEQTLLDDAIRIGATYFDQRFQDLVQYTFTPPLPSDPNFLNVAAANARGVESEFAVQTSFGLGLSGAYTFLLTRVVDGGVQGGTGDAFEVGARLLRRPTHAASLQVRQRFGARGSLAGTVRYVGDRDDRDFAAYPAQTVILPSYVRVDLAGEVDVWRGRGAYPVVALTGRLENAFDAHYQEVSGYPTPGRTVTVGVRVGM
jgi:vitamin B12 transporter